MENIQHIRLSELNRKIQGVLDASFRSATFWVIADVTNHSFKPQKNYHNFDLVEKDPGSNDIIAKITGKAWAKGSLRIEHFERITGQQFTNNISLLLLVSVSFHPVYGLQLELQDVDPTFTLGALEKQRQATLDRLAADNAQYIQRVGDRYITRNNQLSLNPVIQQIAVISSSNSAGAEDFSHTLLSNTQGYRFTLDYYHTEVQGETNAEPFIKKLVTVYNSGKPYDAVVIIRGGGAQTDFLLFDNYFIGRAVARFPIPVITGIGHQKNETITDLMAHTQTKTPTKAAEFIIAHNRRFEERLLSFQKVIIIRTQQLFSLQIQSLSGYSTAIVNKSRDMIADQKDGLARLKQLSISNSTAILFRNRNQMHSISSDLLVKPKIILNGLGKDLLQLSGAMKTLKTQYFKNQNAYIQHYISLVNMMAPHNILKKGFAIVKVKNRVTSNPDDLTVGHEVSIILSDTQIKTTVLEKSTYYGSDFNL